MRRHGVLLFGLVCAGLFLAALFQLLSLRFEAGDVYPPYSSLRADPLGSQALYESLAELPGLELRRNFEPLPTLDQPAAQTLVLLGTSHRALVLPRNEAHLLQGFVRQGGRLVLAFAHPEPGGWDQADEHDGGPTNRWRRSSAPKPSPPPEEDADDLGPQRRFQVNLATEWGFETRLRVDKTTSAAVNTNDPATLPAQLPWRSSLVLANLRTPWQVLYSRRQEPVMAERNLGAGTIVLATDSYFCSNEALWKERAPALLAYLFAQKPQVIFDETHLGVAIEPGVATLARKYRLHGLLAVLLLWAGLGIWRAATPFVPAADALAAATNHVSGRDAAAGFINLLRRSIPRPALLRSCLAEWHRSFSRTNRCSPAQWQQAEAAAADPKAASAPAATYTAIQQILTERK